MAFLPAAVFSELLVYVHTRNQDLQFSLQSPCLNSNGMHSYHCKEHCVQKAVTAGTGFHLRGRVFPVCLSEPHQALYPASVNLRR